MNQLYKAESRLAHYFAKVLETAERFLSRGPGQFAQGLALLDLESRNIKAGQAWAERNAERNQAAARLPH
jgi:hypothetical protein